MHVRVNIGGQQITALVDTGSSATIISLDLYQQLRGVSGLNGPPITLKSFGGYLQESLGSFETDINIEKNTFSIKVDVVQNKMCLSQMLLGRDFLQLAEMSVSCSGIVSFTKGGKKEQITKCRK